MSAPQAVLVVDDEPRMRTMLELALGAAGYAVRTAADASSAWRVLQEESIALVVLDVMMPGVSGLELCQRIREQAAVPVILLTARDAAADRVEGLEAGADDYLAKPFSPRELVLRVGAILRRTSGRQPQRVVGTRRAVGDLNLDAALSLARRGSRDLHLTPSEFRLLWLLTDEVGTLVSTDHLLEAIGHDSDRWGGRAALRTAIYRLRGKIEDGPTEPAIVTEHGRGYRFVTPRRGA